MLGGVTRHLLPHLPGVCSVGKQNLNREKIELQHVVFFTQLILVFLGKKILN